MKLRNIFFGTMVVFVSIVFVPSAFAENESGESIHAPSPLLRAQSKAREVKDQVEQNAERAAQGEERKAVRKENICEDIVNRAKTGFDTRGANREERKDAVDDRKKERFDKNDKALDRSREESNVKRERMYTALLNRAGDDADKKAAVEVFRASVESAVETRRKAVDAAIVSFRSGIDETVGSQHLTMESNLETFRKAAEEAIAKAKTSCESDEDPKTVRVDLQQSLKGARENLRTDRTKIEQAKADIQSFVETRKVAIADAMDEFHLAMESARAKLKESLKD